MMPVGPTLRWCGRQEQSARLARRDPPNAMRKTQVGATQEQVRPCGGGQKIDFGNTSLNPWGIKRNRWRAQMKSLGREIRRCRPSQLQALPARGPSAVPTTQVKVLGLNRNLATWRSKVDVGEISRNHYRIKGYHWGPKVKPLGRLIGWCRGQEPSACRPCRGPPNTMLKAQVGGTH